MNVVVEKTTEILLEIDLYAEYDSFKYVRKNSAMEHHRMVFKGLIKALM
jgi:hypothetical protein